MPLTIAGAWIGAGLLVLAGAAKLARPTAPGRALLLAGLPGGRLAARGLGALEVAVAVLGLGLGGVAWVPQAGLYVAFTAFVLRERTRPSATCGCFGEEGVPLTALHVVVDALLAVGAITAAVVGAPGVAGLGADGVTWLVVPLAALATLVVRMLLVDLPVLADAMHAGDAHAGAAP